MCNILLGLNRWLPKRGVTQPPKFPNSPTKVIFQRVAIAAALLPRRRLGLGYVQDAKV